MLRKGEFYNLPVLGITDEAEGSFYTVQAEGQDYKVKMYNFQRNDIEQRQRKTLPCHVRENKEGLLYLVQNTAQILSSYYEQGQTYPFVVLRALQCDSSAYNRYAAQDHLQVPIVVTCPANAEPLRPRQQIDVRVKHINENRILFLLDNRPSTVTKATLATLLHLGQCTPAQQQFIERVVRTHSAWKNTRRLLEVQSPLWPVKALLATPYADRWLSLKPQSRIALLQIYRRIALHVLEDAEWLAAFSATESERYREAIATRVAGADLHAEALQLVDQRQAEDTIKAVLRKLNQSGYVYDLQHKLSLMMALFSLRKHLLENHIDSLLDFIARKGHAWKNRTLPTAFAHFLERYVRANVGRANRFLGTTSADGRHLLERMVQAICYFLALDGGQTEQRGELQAMLYYYLSLVAPQRTLTDEDSTKHMARLLMDRAFWNLIEAEPFQTNLVWHQDFRQFDVLAHHMLDAQPAVASLVPHSYESEVLRLSLTREGLQLAPTQLASTARNVLPEGFVDWHGLQVMLDDPARHRISPSASLSEWTLWWSDVERSLFSPRPVEEVVVTPVARKLTPEPGTRVKIRVVRRHPNDLNRFYCTIEDERFRGEGWIDTYVKGKDEGLFFYNPFFNLDSFTFEGRPLLFEAIVAGWANPDAEDELLIFNAQPLILEKMHDWVQDFVEEDRTTNCHIYGFARDVTRGGQSMFRGVTEDGYVVNMDMPEDLDCEVHDTVQVRITDVTNVRFMRAEILDFASENVDVKQVTENFLIDYADGEVFTGSDTETSTANASNDCDNDAIEEEEVMMWGDNDMHILLQLLDHQAMLEADHTKAYALLSVAHIVARMIEHQEIVRYFDMRRQLLRQIEHYAVNRQIDRDEVERIMSDAQGIIDRYPALREQLTEILLVGSMGDDSKNDFLWSTTQQYPSSHKLSQLSRLILSFNLTSGFALEGQQEDIRQQIKQLLHIEVELPQSYSFGVEGQQLEFKTSTVFPPDNDMRPHLEMQTNNLMRVVCGMLNALGGTLLLGVNDAGVACGLAEDLNYFNGDLDRLRRHVRDNIFRKFGVTVNDRVRDELMPAGKHVVLAFHIPQSDLPIAFEGDYFVRQGSSTRFIRSAETVRQLMAARSKATTTLPDLSLSSGQDVAADATDALPRSASAEEGSALSSENAETTQHSSAQPQHSAEKPQHNSAQPQHSSAQPQHSLETSAEQSDTLTRLKEVHTSLIRPNVVHNWEEGYGIDTVAYLRFFDGGEWCVMDEENWDEGWLTLAVHDREEKGSLLMVYDDGTINRVPMELCLEKVRGKHFKHYNERTPLFFCPAAPGDALLTAYIDDHGQRFFRLDDIDRLPEGKMLSAGHKIVHPDFEQFAFCEIIPAEHLAGLEKLRNLKDTTLGHSLEMHYEKERNILTRLGIKL